MAELLSKLMMQSNLGLLALYMLQAAAYGFAAAFPEPGARRTLLAACYIASSMIHVSFAACHLLAAQHVILVLYMLQAVFYAAAGGLAFRSAPRLLVACHAISALTCAALAACHELHAVDAAFVLYSLQVLTHAIAAVNLFLLRHRMLGSCYGSSSIIHMGLAVEYWSGIV